MLYSVVQCVLSHPGVRCVWYYLQSSKADALMWYFSNRWKHKAPCTKNCDVCEVKYWLWSRFRPSSAIQTKRILFIFFHQNIPLFYAKFAPHIRDSLLRSIWPVPACTFLLTQVLLYLAQVDLSRLVCVPGGFSHPLLSRWNWIAIFFFSLSPVPPISQERKWPRCQTSTDMLLQRVGTVWDTLY